ncbi:MAG TPA: hypothetical protein VHG93_09405 [Longimicrobium sp.]|nr:hypothetical protein [Longimicrobium sp.]
MLLGWFPAGSVAAQQTVRPESSRDTVYVYQVDIPESAVRFPSEAPQACLARDKDPVKVAVDTTVAAKSRLDSLIVRVVRVEGSTRTAVKPPADVDVYLGTTRRTLTTIADSLRLTANARQLAGQRVTVQMPNTLRPVCSLTLATPPGPTDPPGPRADRPTPDAEAVVSIGASFDFLDGLRANDLYSDVRVFTPRLWSRPPRGLREALPFFARSGVGVQGGIYQGRITAGENANRDSLPEFVFESPVESQDSGATRQIRRRVFERSQSRRENTLNLYMGLNFEIGRDLYWVLPQIEIRKEDTRLSIRDTVISDTTVTVASNYRLVNQIAPVTRVIGITEYVPAVMTGPRLDMRRSTFNLVLQPLVGTSRMMACSREPGAPTECERKWRLLQYDVTFELEAAQSGIKLGGEVRGFQARNPNILIFLAKEFTIEKFAEFFTGSKGR